jgi:RimJ/RimL family protein N-acetyltransferase
MHPAYPSPLTGEPLLDRVQTPRPCAGAPPLPRRPTPRRVVVLAGGTRILLRPLRREDREVYLRGFEHLSERSRYMRFFSPKNLLTEAELRYFLDVDHHHHEAIAAVDLDSGEGVGVARFIRDPDDPDIAEVSVAVVDDHQGRGLGAVLLRAIARRAREEGVCRFRATVLADNTRMLSLIRARWPHHDMHRRPASVLELEFDL